ncbi:MAG: glycosyltransferase [Nitrososphaerota archaeon]|nr:glycosyltransferase [Nitrososphaerota archaeon]
MPEVVGFSIVVMGVIANVYLLNYVYLALLSFRKRNDLTTVNVEEWPVVSIHIPVYNERYVIGRLIEAVSNLDYPRDKLQVIIVDDSTDDTSEIIEKTINEKSREGIEFIHLKRPSREGFKAGALQAALNMTRGEFVAIFDADFVPPRDFLKKALEHLLVDERKGVVQVRWEHINRRHSTLTRGQALNLDLHFEVEQKARSAASLFLNFNGTAGVWRKDCVVKAGGWRSFLAEDLELSVRAQLMGWKVVYIGEPACPGEVPPQIQAAKRQQYRWAYGAIEVAKEHLLSILKSDVKAAVKLQAILHLTRHVPYLLFLAVLALTPIALLLNVYTVAAPSAAAWALVSAALVAVKFRASGLHDFPHMLLFVTSMTVNNSLAVIDALLGRKRTFQRTPKFGEGEWKGKNYVLPFDAQSYLELALGVVLLIAALISVLKLMYGYTFYLTIAGASLIYAGSLSITHAPTPRRRSGGRVRLLRYLILGMLTLGIAVTVIGYSQTYYRLDIANAYIVRAASSSSAEEIVDYMERALEILPREGNPVWIFPTPRTDFGLITKDLMGLKGLALALSRENVDSSAYQQGLDQLKDSLLRIREQIAEAAPFYFVSPLSLLLFLLWLIAFALLLRAYLRVRGTTIETDGR